MKVALINPNLLVQRNDRFTTGVIYMPITLAYAAAVLRAAGNEVTVVDAFGSAPRQVRRAGAFTVHGLTPQQVVERVGDAGLAFVFANQLLNHQSLVEIVAALGRRVSRDRIGILENTQAVTAYSLSRVAQTLFDAGAGFLVTGEPEHRCVEVVKAFESGPSPERLLAIDGVCLPNRVKRAASTVEDLDALPWPAWDLFPLQGYWGLRFAHGPLSSRRYLPLLTSRGCPYPCTFCVVPETNSQTWRARSAANVADEMAHWGETLGVREFHIEDLNPTINDGRVRALCSEITTRGLEVKWKLAAGTKAETIRDAETIEAMARAGCTYISISPETGSPDVLKRIRKPFNLSHAVRIIGRMNDVGIRSQACFVLGFPGETASDRKLTRDLVKDLTRSGVDEIALFIISPVPGSAIFDQFGGYQSLSELNFTPTWREDYRELNSFRVRLYGSFLLWKLRYHPLKVLRQVWNFLTRRFETKMEMVPYKAAVYAWLDR